MIEQFYFCPDLPSAGWGTFQNAERPGWVHVVPIHDVKDHYSSMTCGCGVVRETQYNGPHVNGVVFTHNAYDGRT